MADALSPRGAWTDSLTCPEHKITYFWTQTQKSRLFSTRPRLWPCHYWQHHAQLGVTAAAPDEYLPVTDTILSSSHKWPPSSCNNPGDNVYPHFADEETEAQKSEWQSRDSTLGLSNSAPASSLPAAIPLLHCSDPTKQLHSIHWFLTFFFLKGTRVSNYFARAQTLWILSSLQDWAFAGFPIC